MGRGSGRDGSVHLEDVPSRVKDDVERYLEEESNPSERDRVLDEASALEYARRVLARKPGLGAFVREFSRKDEQLILEGSHIRELLRKNNEGSRGAISAAGAGGRPDPDALRLAQRIEARRPRNSRVVDELRDARKIVPATPAGVRRWRKNPSKMDVAGVDTRMKWGRINRRNRVLTPRRTKRWVRHVVSRGTYGYYVYRDLKGKFIKSPEKRK